MPGFPKILIPVDFSEATGIAVSKAFSFLEQHGQLFLLHVARAGYSDKARQQYNENAARLQELRIRIVSEHPAILVKTLILYGHSVEFMILEGCRMLAPDLVIIGRQGKTSSWPFRKRLSPDRIARKTHCPVLTVRAGAVPVPLRSIVIPIRQNISDRKLDLTVQLARKFRARIHLLVFGATQDTAFGQPFLKAYRHLRDQLQLPIEHSSCIDRHAAKATLHFAETVKADMILLDPEAESGIPSWTGLRHISDLIPDHSSIQVMEIGPE